MIPEWLTPPAHEQNASRFEQELGNLAWQHAFEGTTNDKSFLRVEWERLRRPDVIDKMSALVKKIGHRKLLELTQLVGDRADEASAWFAEIEVQLTASDQELIEELIPTIISTVLSCGGTPGQHSLEYQPLEEGEGIPGYWYSQGTHTFES